MGIMRTTALSAALFCAVTSKARSSDLVFTPINPSFGGAPFNSSHLLGLANAQNEPKRKADEQRQQQARTTQSDRFIQLLQSRLYSSLAAQVSDSIFGDGAQNTGRIKLQDQEVAWVNTGSEIRLTVTDHKTGQISEIIVPTLIQ